MVKIDTLVTKMAKKLDALGPHISPFKKGQRESRASAFYYPGPVFDFKKNYIAQAIAHQINHVQPKEEKKIHAPENCPTPPSSSPHRS